MFGLCRVAVFMSLLVGVCVRMCVLRLRVCTCFVQSGVYS